MDTTPEPSVFAGVEKLRGHENYSLWKFQMKNLLVHEDLWHAIEGYPDGDSTDEATRARNDQLALSKMNLLLGVSCIPHTMRAQTAIDAWHSLENVYEHKGRSHLFQKLLSMKLDDYLSVEDYINKVTSISEQIAAIGNPVDEEIIGAVLLKGLSNIDEFEPLIMFVEESGSVVTGDLVKKWLMRSYDNQQEESVNEVVQERHSFINWFQKTSTSIAEKVFMQNRKSIRNTTQSSRNRMAGCWECGQQGHVRAQCPNNGQPNQRKTSVSRRVVSAVAETVVVRTAVAAGCAVGGAVGGAIGGAAATAATMGAKILRKK